MTLLLLTWGVVAFALSFVLAGSICAVAKRLGLVDRPDAARKIHARDVPLMGGLAIFLSLALVLLWLLRSGSSLTGGEITALHYLGFLLGGLVLMIGGYLDDRYRLPPVATIWAPMIAALVLILFGVEVEKLTNPFGGVIYLQAWQSDVIVFVWLLVVMYTTKFLDGLDGLATSISTVGAFMIMLLSLTLAYLQPDVALMSAIAIGALLGFLFWNLHPAKLFLGEGGSTFVGYLLGTLAVISGGKLATALLVLGIPLLDVIWIVVRRLKEGGVRRVARGDKEHLHHRLLAIGWGQGRIVIVYVLFATVFGALTFFLQSREKLTALIVLALAMALFAFFIVSKQREGYVGQR